MRSGFIVPTSISSSDGIVSSAWIRGLVVLLESQYACLPLRKASKLTGP